MANISNEIYEQIKEGSITLEQGSKKIVEAIFKNPIQFGITKMKEDEKSEFILYLLTHMDRIIINYIVGMSSFSTYLINGIRKLKCAWYREYYHKNAQLESVQQYFLKEEARLMHEDSHHYELSETYGSNFVINNKNYAFKVLVLALKSSYYLNTEHIRLLSLKTGYSEKVIYELKEKIEKVLQDKIDRNNKIKQKINSAYIKRNSCIYELMCVDNYSTISERLKKKETQYSKQWNKYIEKLHKSSRVKPSNTQLAEALEVREHVVYRILHEFKYNKKFLVASQNISYPME